MITENIYISDEITHEGVVIGFYLPFGNVESVEINRDEAKEIIQHLNKIFELGGEP